MIKLLMSSTISAMTFSVIMFYANKAGIKEARSYGVRPGQHTGNYSRKVKQALGWNKRSEDLYYIDLPGHSKHDLERTPQLMPVMPAFEQMNEDLKDAAGDRTQFRERLEQPGGLPPNYWNHPIVQSRSEGELVWPYAIYMDGVPYSHTDSVIGFWISNLITGKRYLIVTLRKRIICQCGCRGWCTIFGIMVYLRWEARILAAGVAPSERHDRRAWLPSDRKRATNAGTPMIKGACLYIKGDWMEFASTMGMPTWSDSIRPCFDCNCMRSNMYQVAGSSMDQLTWHLNNDLEYYTACDRCEIKVTLRNKNEVTQLENILRYDKRENGSHGRSLTRGIQIDGKQLLEDDRLEPSDELYDIGALAEIVNFPINIVFWRLSEESLTRHRNPLFDRTIGITPKRTLTVDVLHAFFLGILLVWSRIAIWHLITSGAYGDLGTQAENIEIAVIVLRAALLNWYPKYEHAHPGEILTRISDLTSSMLGEITKQKLKTKGAETWGVALFLIDELELRSAVVGTDGANLLMAGRSLEKIVRIWKGHDWTMPLSAAKENASRP